MKKDLKKNQTKPPETSVKISSLGNSYMRKNSKPAAKLFKAAKIKPFSLPASFLKQLNEFCAGGYMLFMKDEQGEIATYQKFDTSADALAIIKYSADFAGMLNAAASQGICNLAIENSGLEEPPDDCFRDL